jgi:hypothetical protein
MSLLMSVELMNVRAKLSAGESADYKESKDGELD